MFLSKPQEKQIQEEHVPIFTQLNQQHSLGATETLAKALAYVHHLGIIHRDVKCVAWLVGRWGIWTKTWSSFLKDKFF